MGLVIRGTGPVLVLRPVVGIGMVRYVCLSAPIPCLEPGTGGVRPGAQSWGERAMPNTLPSSPFSIVVSAEAEATSSGRRLPGAGPYSLPCLWPCAFLVSFLKSLQERPCSSDTLLPHSGLHAEIPLQEAQITARQARPHTWVSRQPVGSSPFIL